MIFAARYRFLARCAYFNVRIFLYSDFEEIWRHEAGVRPPCPSLEVKNYMNWTDAWAGLGKISVDADERIHRYA